MRLRQAATVGVVVTGLVAAGAFACAQSRKPAPAPGVSASTGWMPVERPIRTAKEAVVAARAFLNGIGVDAKAARCTKVEGSRAAGIFRLQFDKRRKVWLSARLGTVTNYWDEARLDFEGRRPEPQSTVFKQKKQAMDKLWSIARKLGSPADATTESADVILGTPGKRGYRCVQAHFVWKLNGLPVFGSDLGVSIALDPRDGVCTYIDDKRDFVIEPSKPRVSADEASRLAVSAADKLEPVKHEAEAPEFGYVLSSSRNSRRPFVVRLGWRVPLRGGITYEVAIDAETGKLLGSKDTASRKPPNR